MLRDPARGLPNGMRVINKSLVQNTSEEQLSRIFSCEQSAAPKSREIQSIYPNLHDEFLLMNVDNHTGLFAVLRIFIACLTCMCAPSKLVLMCHTRRVVNTVQTNSQNTLGAACDQQGNLWILHQLRRQ